MIILNGQRFILPKQREIIIAQSTRPRFHRFPKYQRGVLHPIGFWQEAVGPLNATNTVVQKTVDVGQCNSGVDFNNDGTMDDIGPAISDRTLLGLDFNSIDHTGEWHDDSPTGSEWEISCLSMVAGTWDTAAASLGVYVALNVGRIWKEQRGGGKSYTPGTNTATGNFRIREVADTSNLVNFTMKGTAIQT